MAKWSFHSRTAAILAGVVVASAALVAGANHFGLRINPTPSMPMGLYRVVYNPASHLQVGDTVTACAPAPAELFARQRGYLMDGHCPGGGGMPVVKQVAAVAGDVVNVTPNGVYVDGRRWPMSVPHTHDPKGRPLSPDWGLHLIPRGQVWLMGKNTLSWDSRYWGAVSLRSVRHELRPVWVGK
jgi:conjugative transfer signal peptidase TraF